MKARRFLVSGVVQGVGYRFFAARAGRTLGLRGGTRNLPDGRVEVVAAGEEDALDRLRNALAQGPRAARVSGVETHDVDVPAVPPGGWDVEF